MVCAYIPALRVIPVVRNEDEDVIIHTDDHPFCEDLSCPCHADQNALAAVGDLVTNGLMTPAEADAVYHGLRSL